MPRLFNALVLLAAAAAPAAAQTALYSNGSAIPTDPGLSTGAVSASGVPAPITASWSELQGPNSTECNAVAGFSGHFTTTSGAFRFADDFTVPAPGYRLTRIAFFVYQTGAPAMTSPVSAVNLRILSAPPTDPAAVVLFGDTTTDHLHAATPTTIYRILNSVVAPLGGAPDTSRHIWRIEADLGSLDLDPGTYWLDWQHTSADPSAEVFTPPVTRQSTRSLPTWNALQLKSPSTNPPIPATWLPLLDPAKPAAAADLPQDLPFILLGGTACAADWNADTLVNSSDISSFLTAWIASVTVPNLIADFNGDGATNSTDISAFLTAWLDAVINGC